MTGSIGAAALTTSRAACKILLSDLIRSHQNEAQTYMPLGSMSPPERSILAPGNMSFPKRSSPLHSRTRYSYTPRHRRCSISRRHHSSSCRRRSELQCHNIPVARERSSGSRDNSPQSNRPVWNLDSSLWYTIPRSFNHRQLEMSGGPKTRP